MTEMLPELLHAKEIADTDPDEALRICNNVMNDHLDDIYGQVALFMSGYVMLEAGRTGLAYHIFKRCAELQPNRAEIFLNMGMCLENERQAEAIACFERCAELSPDNAKAYANAGLIYLLTGRPEKCIEYSAKALTLDPNIRAAVHNKGLAQIMLHDWVNGWKAYADTLGVKHREARDYGIPDWDGKAKGRLLVYMEQGVGDEIMFASVLPDMLADGLDIVLDADSRTAALFARSFPDIRVYGTRYHDESPIMRDDPCDYQIAAGNLLQFYRPTPESCPGTPYLRLDVERCIQWRALFDTFKGRKIGIAWRGGIRVTGKAKRSMELSDLEPILNDSDTFISLEYKPADYSGFEHIKQYPRATAKGGDIDDLAALISQLDLVVTACTTVVYVAGALGIPCYVLVPSEPSYRYGMRGDFPWYKSVYLHRQRKGEKWINCVKRLAPVIAKREIKAA